MKMNGQNHVPSRPYFYIFAAQFSYLRTNTEIGREAGRSISRPYLWDPILKWDDPVLILYL